MQRRAPWRHVRSGSGDCRFDCGVLAGDQDEEEGDSRDCGPAGGGDGLPSGCGRELDVEHLGSRRGLQFEDVGRRESRRGIHDDPVQDMHEDRWQWNECDRSVDEGARVSKAGREPGPVTARAAGAHHGGGIVPRRRSRASPPSIPHHASVVETIKASRSHRSDIQDWADEAERGYDVEQLRKRGPKPIGDGPAPWSSPRASTPTCWPR